MIILRRSSWYCDLILFERFWDYFEREYVLKVVKGSFDMSKVREKSNL